MQYGHRPVATDGQALAHPIVACCLTGLQPLSDHTVSDGLLLLDNNKVSLYTVPQRSLGTVASIKQMHL